MASIGVYTIFLLMVLATANAYFPNFIQFCRSDYECRWRSPSRKFCMGGECERWYQLTPCQSNSDCTNFRNGRYRLCRNMYCRKTKNFGR